MAKKQQPVMTTDQWGNKFWRLPNGQRHREDGPAIEWANGSKWWYTNGKYHREDGPAVEWADGYKEWWINGKKLTEEEWSKDYPRGVPFQRDSEDRTDNQLTLLFKRKNREK